MPAETQGERRPLDALAAELNERCGIRANICAPLGGAPYLKATNPRAPRLTEEITVRQGQYWWSWGDCIGPVYDPQSAASRITRVLRDQ